MTTPDPADAPLMLSVSGLRGIVGQSITPERAARYGAAVGTFFQSQAPAGTRPTVAIGRDSRPSGDAFSQAVAAGLASTGCDVVRLGIASTPGVAIMVQALQCAGGVVITASHNPVPWNGIKAIRHDGTAPPPDQAQAIVDTFHAGTFAYAGPTGFGTIRANSDVVQTHLDKVLPLVNADAIRAANLKVVLDSVHGAGGPEAAALLDALGVQRVHLYAEPTGLFPHTPEPTRDNLTELADAVTQHNAAVGFAQDPDADRLALVDHQGTYIGEEYTLALCAKHLLKPGDHCVANLSTSRMLDDLAHAAGATVHRSAVGEANVASVMRDTGASVGGEGNGGIIDPRVSYVRDSIVGIALTLDLLATTGQTLADHVAATPSYAIVKQKADATPELIAAIGPRLRDAFKGEQLNDADGVRVDLPNDRAWVHVRPSNTEPIVRLIAEAPDEPTAHALITRAKQALSL